MEYFITFEIACIDHSYLAVSFIQFGELDIYHQQEKVLVMLGLVGSDFPVSGRTIYLNPSLTAARIQTTSGH